MAGSSQIPRGHHRQKLNFMKQVDYKSTLEYGAVNFGRMAPSNIDRLQVSQNQDCLLFWEYHKAPVLIG